MRNWMALCVVCILLWPMAASAYVPDVSELTTEELVQLNEQIVVLLGEREDKQPFTLPPGFWTVGVNIPVGTYTVRATDGGFLSFFVESASDPGQFFYGAMLYSESYRYYQEQYTTELQNVELRTGTVVCVSDGTALLTSAAAILPLGAPETLATPEPTPAPTPEITPEPTPQPTPAPTRTPIKAGDAGEAVRELQERLQALGYLRDKVDGIFGAKTGKAVEDFQIAAGLEATGIADEATQAALFAGDAF